MGPTILLQTVDSELAMAVLQAAKAIDGVQLSCTRDSQQSLELLVQQQEVPLAIIHLVDTEAIEQQLEFVRHIKRRYPSSLVFAILDDYQPERDCALREAGALECFSRPLDIRRFGLLADLATLKSRYNLMATDELTEEEPLECLGDDASFLYGVETMSDLMQQVRTSASTSATLLLTGETGCGKTMLAGLIHELSPRRSEPFVVMNCGTVTPTLVESELFGHTKGAFTGAMLDRAGKMATAKGGTLMIDEIDSLPMAAQARLLRACDERVFEPVGSDRALPLRARLIVASNRSLEQEVKAGRFRADLFYRINVVSLNLPPLRDRPTLIKPLALRFLGEFARRYGRPTPSVDDHVLAALRAYHWPGNIRELRNVIERCVAVSNAPVLSVELLPQEIQRCAERSSSPQGQSGWFSAKSRSEPQAIREALRKTNNNRARAAEELGISRVTLYKKLHKYGLI